jgi:hypothetical protein
VNQTLNDKAEEMIATLGELGQDKQALRTLYLLGIEVGRAQAKGEDIEHVPLFLRRQAQ